MALKDVAFGGDLLNDVASRGGLPDRIISGGRAPKVVAYVGSSGSIGPLRTIHVIAISN